MQGIVQNVADTPRSYVVPTKKSGTLCRNCCHLHTSGESFQFRSNEVPDNVPVADSISHAADHEECSASSAPVSPESAACSFAEPSESVSSPSSSADLPPVLPLRRSSRRVKPPDRLNL